MDFLLPGFDCSIVVPVKVSYMSSMTFYFGKHYLYLGVLILSDQPNVQFIIICHTKTIIRHKKWIFSFITIPWIHPLKFIPMYLKFPVIPVLLVVWNFILFNPSYLVLFCLVYFSLGVRYSHLIFSYTNHLQ